MSFLVRALDEGGLVYENTEAKTLDEAMTLLEQGISNWLGTNGVDLGRAEHEPAKPNRTEQTVVNIVNQRSRRERQCD